MVKYAISLQPEKGRRMESFANDLSPVRRYERVEDRPSEKGHRLEGLPNYLCLMGTYHGIEDNPPEKWH